MKTYISRLQSIRIFIFLAGIGLAVSSFFFKHYKLHYIEKESEYITVVDKKEDTSPSYTGIMFLGFIKISMNEPRYFLYLTREKQTFSVRYGQKYLDSKVLQKKKLEVSQSDFEKYKIGDVLSYNENEELWNKSTYIYE